jgi:PPP family 3-phenylpropionic acid transporter
VLAVVALGVALANLSLGFLHSFHAALLGTAVLAVFSTVVLSMSTAVTLAGVDSFGPNAFGQVRMFGTLGFLAAVVVFPQFLAQSPRTEIASLHWDGLAQMFPVTALLTLMAAALALKLPRTPALSVRSQRGDLKRLLRHPPAVRLVFVVLAAHLFVQGPINLFPLYITDRGGDVTSIGKMWIFMLLLEIPLIGFSGQTLRRLGARGLLTVGLLAEGVRWITCALTTDLDIIRAVMLLHGLGVAGIIVGGPLYLEQAVPARLRSTGQALVASAGFGAGAILSVSAVGWLFDRFGANIPYGLAGSGALLLGLLVFRLLPEPYRPLEEAISEDPGLR